MSASTGRTSTRSHGGDWRGWVLPVALACAVGGVMALAAAAVKLPAGPGLVVGRGEPRPAPPELAVTRIDRLPRGGEVRERLRLLDPTPLFMPAERVGGALLAAEGMGQRPSGDAGASFPAALAFPDQGPARDILQPAPPKMPLTAAEIVAGPRWFADMARRDVFPTASAAAPTPAELAGAGRVEVYRVGRGERLASAELPADPTLEAGSWAPMELTVLVSVAGVVAAPVVIGGSGAGEVDERVRALLAAQVLPRLRLRPGTYRVVAGP